LENSITSWRKLAFLVVLLGSGREAKAYTEAEVRSAAVELRATVSAAVPRVTLQWNASPYPVSSQTVSRRLPGAGAWEFTTALSTSAVSWADTTAANQTLYEYRVERVHLSPLGHVAEGWIWAGSEVPAVEGRGRLILAVDATMAGSLADELHRLVSDLTGDGWEVVRTDIARTATPTQARDAIRGWYAVDPVRTRAVLLLGRLPVPYSGMVCPDGHWDPPPMAHHRGAWPTDAFYGDMDGVWTDTSVNYSLANVAGTRNHNVPGDGKFDVSLLVGEHLPEIAVGRIDLADMGGIADGLTEAELLRRYLDRHHAFRHRQGSFAALGERALVDDTVFGPAWGFPTATSGWTSGISLFGASNTTAGDWIPALRDQDYLVAYGCGPGAFDGAGGIGTSADFRDTRCRAIFNLTFGSYFGDWDSNDNYLRAPLVGRSDSRGLVSLWSGVPMWRLFPLAAGGTMADAYRHVVHEVNQPGGPFPPTDESWTSPDQSHVALMGDPTLRSHPVMPVSSLNAVFSGNQVSLSWVNPASESNRLGSRVYRSTSVYGPYSRVGGQTAVDTTAFLDTPPHPGRWYYMVRTVKRQATASASYDNLAQGVLAEIDVPTTGYAAWSAGLGNPADSVDSNGDGVPNLLAYAVGAASGMIQSNSSLPRQEVAGFLVPYSGREDLVYEVQRSLNLSAWHAVARKNPGNGWVLNAASGYPHQGSISLTLLGGEAIRVQDATGAVRGFWRMRVAR
jgi:hypothetical protein